MGCRIRLSHIGRRNLKMWRIVVADARAPRDGKFIEILGSFNPYQDNIGNRNVRLNMKRLQYWMSVGAQPSDTVTRILAKFNIFPMPPVKLEVPITKVLPQHWPQPKLPTMPTLSDRPERY